MTPSHASSRRLRLAAIAALGLALAVLGCGAARPGAPLALPSATPPATATTTGPSHVVVIVMENKELNDVIGNAQAPYVNRLANRYALATDYHAISHPSLPNYLALVGGNTFGINSDCTDCAVNATNLVDQLSRARVNWTAYMEDLPRPCFTGAGVAGYAKKHDPFVYFTDVRADRSRCDRVVPLTRLATDLRAGALAPFAWITPNLCDDMHDCGVGVGDRFLAQLVPALIARLGPRGVLALVWDEGSSDSGCCRLAAGGRVPLILAGPGVRRGRFAAPADHYSLLALIDDALGLARLGNAACACTPSLAGMFTRVPRVRRLGAR